MQEKANSEHVAEVASPQSERPLLQGKGLSRRYGATYALREVDFSVHSGRVHALLGHNGAGKSTLISLLSGAQKPDEGSLTIGDHTPTKWTPSVAIEQGIAVIYQHLSLVNDLTVADNIFLGHELMRNGRIDRRTQVERSATLLAELGAECNPNDIVGSLTTAQRQLVEIAKALQRDAKVLILDEPTASLSNREAHALSVLINTLKSRGMGIVYVTHLLSEVERLADDVTVLEGGRVQFHDYASSLDHESLVQLLSKGNATSEPITAREHGIVALTANTLSGEGFGPVNMHVREREVLVLFGMLGSGRGEFLRALAGLQHSTGTVNFAETGAKPPSLRLARTSGVVYVGPDRRKDGIFAELNTFDNVLMSSFSALSRGARNHRLEQKQWSFARETVGLGEVQAMPTGRLSGGNQQKAVVGRAIGGAKQPSVILLDEPTQGVDIGARRDLYRAIEWTCLERNTSVILSTNDPEEAVALADRVMVFSRGVVVAELNRSEITEETLIALASAIYSDNPSTSGSQADGQATHTTSSHVQGAS